MAFHVFFSFSTGLAKSITAPRGTKAAIQEHVKWIERTLNLERERYLKNPIHWSYRTKEAPYIDFPDIDSDDLCNAVTKHNEWVRRMYENFAEWAETPPKGKVERISPQNAKKFWHAFELLEVPLDRWNRDYYRNRMEHLYEVMRGRESEGVTFDEKALTPRQAAQVINIFSTYVDDFDLRLDCPKDRDYLASSYDGGYSWCDKCGCAIAEDDVSCTKRGCPLRLERE